MDTLIWSLINLFVNVVAPEIAARVPTPAAIEQPAQPPAPVAVPAEEIVEP